MDCTPCAYAAEHGWWGDTLPKGAETHCRVCHVSIPGGNNWGHCVACHQTFRGVSAFDRHQMVADCPNNEGTVSALAAYVCDALSSTAAAEKAKGKRHYLIEAEHVKLGYMFWRWVTPEEAANV